MFSIIIPVYNSLSNGLDKCLQSIWEQPLDKSLYEVICIDDCSTDNTLEWLYAQQKIHTNLIIVANEHNLRQGGSRNRGMRVASRKYIAFVDQDDYYHEGVLLKIFEHFQQNQLDILIVDCAYQRKNKECYTLQHNFKYRHVMSGDEMIVKNSIPYAPWKFIFKRSLIFEHNIFFCENERIEDIDWSHTLVHYGRKVQYQPILLVHYNKHNSSTTMTMYKSPDITYSTLKLTIRLHNTINTVFLNSNDEVKRSILNVRYNFLWVGLRNYLAIYDKPAIKAKNISDAACNEDINNFKNVIVKFAVKNPLTYSILSNISVPVVRILIRVYRNFKYN